ncbi:MAG: hypothetical protein A2603_09595 [Bdellovibrionales bacterium RIFOXYD1_FULL_55_31]|nr:MAG: hypothetical protein A2603_09595 [Bdellovibrionales bacterium RIFOXYD1_FULL_55_31]
MFAPSGRKSRTSAATNGLLLPGAADYSTAFKWSVIGHGMLMAFVIVKSLVFPGNPVPYVPTLRVDIVGLPDALRKDLSKPATSASLTDIKKALDKVDQELRRAKLKTPAAPIKETADKPAADEMVLKPKHPDTKGLDKKLKGALARIRALEKISADGETRPTVVKGNFISKGSSLSGDARESAESNYYDNLRSKLQESWALPVWVARQNLSAQVQIYIDGRGRLRTYRFVKLSGNSQFDGAVKQTLMESQPFPVPPPELASSILVDGILVGFPL